MILLILAAFTLLLFVGLLMELVKARRTIRKLAELSQERESWPSVSVIVAARDEEGGISVALDSVLNLHYEKLEVIFVDDRSTDRTGEIVKAKAGRDPRIKLLTIRELPGGWLGKNHALHVGAAAASGDYLLFTDADVVFERTALRRAVAYMEHEEIDHLTAGPEVSVRSIPLGMFIATFAFFFVLYARPWRAKNPHSSDHVGIGAFNLVRTENYRRLKGHSRIAMRTDDDMMLGKLLKKSGARQEFVSAVGMIRVEWYPSIGEAIRGLEKNAFTGLGYSVGMLLAATVLQLAFYFWPFAALFLTVGTTRLVNFVVVIVMLGIVGALAAQSGSRWWYAFGFPAGVLLFVYVLWRSAILAIRNDGIQWRGTHYSLAELRGANKI